MSCGVVTPWHWKGLEVQINQVVFAGRMGRGGVHVKQLQSGMQLAEFQIGYAYKRRKDDDNLSWTNLTVKCFDKTAESAVGIPEGANVLAVGELQEESWEKDGERKYKMVMIANRVAALGDSRNEQTTGQKPTASRPAVGQNRSAPIRDDEVPF